MKELFQEYIHHNQIINLIPNNNNTKTRNKTDQEQQKKDTKPDRIYSLLFGQNRNQIRLDISFYHYIVDNYVEKE